MQQWSTGCRHFNAPEVAGSLIEILLKVGYGPEGRHIVALFTRRNSRLRKRYAT